MSSFKTTKWMWLSCLGLLACDPAVEESELSSLAESAQASGSVELETNLLQGRVRLTNQNPAILTLLSQNTRRNTGAVSVGSTSPSGFSASTQAQSIQFTGVAAYDFQMLVEAGAGGEAGIVYTVSSSVDGYTLPSVPGVRVKPRSVQPEPTQVELQSCVGAVQFLFGTDATCQTPVAVTGVGVSGVNIFQNSTGRFTGFITGGSSAARTLTYSASTPSGSVRTSRIVTVSAGCDEVVPLCTVVDPVWTPTGTVTGPFDVPGHTVRSSTVALTGSTTGSTLTAAPKQPSAPASDPSLWWSIPNVSEGSHTMYGVLALDSGRNYSYYTLTPQLRAGSPTGSVQVVGGQTVSPVKDVDGQPRHAFVMNPAYFYGSVRLVDPSVPLLPGAYSTLEALYFDADHDSNGDGIPNNRNIGTYSTAVRSTAPTSGEVWTGFPGSFRPATGELSSTYEQPLLSPYDLPLQWTQSYLALRFWTQGATRATKPGLYDPVRFRYGSLVLVPSANRSALMQPEGRFRIDHEYCFNEVQVQYTTQVGRLYNPLATVAGSFNGVDWRGRPVAYSTSGSFYGTPAVWGVSDDARLYAESSGSISMALPQGSYTVTPTATLVSDAGGVNVASFAPISVTLGCGQRLKLVPPLSVVMTQQENCATSGSVPVSGIVKSKPAVVDRIWYRVNGGPEVTLCTNCGQDPSFSFTTALKACDNTLEVYAFSEGMPEPAFAVQQLVWDEPSDGPSCGGAQCVNRPPVARCKSIVVSPDSSASGCGSVDDGSYDPDGSGTFSCVQSPSCSYPLGAHKVQLTCTDDTGLSSSCEATVTVRDNIPPVLTCPDSVDLVCAEGGAQALYSVSSSDACGAAVTCSAPSGSTLAPGASTITCSAVDCGGNRVSCSFPVQVEAACPAPLKVTLCNQPAFTKENTLNLCGWATPGASGSFVSRASFIINGGAPIPVVPDASGGFVKTTAVLQDGPNDIQLVARDARGYLTVQRQRVFVDKVAPILTILAPTEGQALGSRTVLVRSSVEDAATVRVTTAAQFHAYLPAGGGVVEQPVSSFSTTGYNSISVEATDAAGNSLKRIVRVWLDWVGPEVRTDLADGASVARVAGDSISYGLNIISKSATTVTFSHLPGKQFSLPRGGGRLVVPMHLQPGANTFTIEATSETGLTATVTRTLQYGP